ncbi:Mut7-C RNAse domain-containing protein [Tichowtungia aerotolerans]|uniref:Twitching motility protein PilT n=1 Tax=Tichowtungia aerotolerans TaxID=2697043 RepID=A0A6P1M6G2_9BACT|nr:Mut7-C RNAse domain-containing protein [Tichowtungia aerotolerans]QHI69441.1 twitching motility protein PilT [Tichowtungia aerotolerans]
MKEHMAQFRFYEELNDFLPPDQRKEAVNYSFNGCPAIKDPIEAMGVPHTEVELIIVNGESVGFEYRLRVGDRVAVYPVCESLDVLPLVRLRPEPLRRTAFVLDVHLGKLARILRLLGFDVLYRNDFNDEEIIRISLAEHRIILTRDRPMLFNKIITHAHWLHSTDAEEQAVEVLQRFDLFGRVQMFHRCPVCNGFVQPVEKEHVLDRLEPLTKKYYDLFFKCSDCGKIYWQGTHYDRILQRLERIRRS